MSIPMTPSDDWQPFAHSPRHPLVTCAICGDRLVNESNILRRHGWQETTSTPRRYPCGPCGQEET